MRIDWTTFVLELLNFLVLLWLLKHFFYKPVLAVLDARKKNIEDQVARAAAAKRDADTLKQQYEDRLNSWQQERQQMHDTLTRELAQERNSQLDALKQSLADERSKEQARITALNAQRESQLMRQAIGEAYAAAALMLRRLASPALTERIAGIVVEDLAAQSPAQRATLREAAAGDDGKMEIATAHDLSAASLRTLVEALQEASGQVLQAEVVERPDLIAGVRISLGQCLLQANLSEELAFFRENRLGGKNA